ncbi:unnamed protein product [Blepharisma stoltei]|uniref:Uncharacterized protein n=1 Tax=Blepharisma stoltei TaxID=1481888 RepID=A0AAU9JY50_9CILI|nr:unnamed protein product [Blepharisma stoltei]
MSENPTEESYLTQSSYRDYLEYKQLKLERDALLRKNHFYIDKLSEMEVKITELENDKELLQEKYKEMKKILIKYESKALDENEEIEDLKEEYKILKKENLHLRREVIPKLETQLEDEQHMRLQIEPQIEQVVAENEELSKKFNYCENLIENIYKTNNVQIIQKVIANAVKELNLNFVVEDQFLSSSRLNSSRSNSAIGGRAYQRTPKKRKSRSNTPRSRSGGRSTRPNTPSSKSTHSSRCVEYIPSFMRVRKKSKRRVSEKLNRDQEMEGWPDNMISPDSEP